MMEPEKITKWLWKTLPMLLIAGMFASCSNSEVDSGYLSGKFRLDFATVRFQSSAPILICDFQDTLVSDTISSFKFTQKSGQRVVVNHSPDEGAGIVIHSIGDVLTSQIYTANLDTLHADAVTVQSIWTGGGYLNMILYINYYSKSHKFGLYRSSDSPNELQLSHNKQGDSEGYPVRVYLSFLMSGFQKEESSDSTYFTVAVPISSGLKTYSFSLP